MKRVESNDDNVKYNEIQWTKNEKHWPISSEMRAARYLCVAWGVAAARAGDDFLNCDNKKVFWGRRLRLMLEDAAGSYRIFLGVVLWVPQLEHHWMVIREGSLDGKFS